MRNSSGVPLGSTAFKTMPLGGGGFATGITIANSGAMVHQEDVFGGYYKAPGATTWKQMFLSTTLPAADFGPNMPDSNGAGYTDSAQGCYAAAIAPSNDQVVYATWNAYWYVSTNGCASWTRLAGPYYMQANSVPGHIHCRRSIVDPTNPSVAMLGPMGQGGKIVYTTNGTTTTELAVAVGTTSYPYTPAVDPTSAVGGSCQTWAYSIPGTGIYESTTGIGGTYTLVAGSPATVNDMKYDAVGTLWVCPTGANGLYKKVKGGSLVAVSTPAAEWCSIAINPANTNSIVCTTSDGHFIVSADGGATWIHNDIWNVNFPAPYGISTFTASIKWLGSARGSTFHPSEIRFHPTNGKLYASTGVGVYWSVPPTAWGEWTWFEDSFGIESLETNWALKPPGRPLIVGVNDRGYMAVTDYTRWTNSQTIPHKAGDTALGHGWHVDYVPGDPTTLIGTCSFQSNCNAKTADSFATWTNLGDHPDGFAVGGCMVAQNASTLFWFPNQNMRACKSTDGGATWSLIPEFALMAAGGAETGFGFSMWNSQRVACSDKATGDVYCYNYGPTAFPSLKGVWYCAAGGTTFVQKCSSIPGFGIGGGVNTRLKMPLGRPGHLFAMGDNNTPLCRSTDYGATWSSIANTANVKAFGFGKAAPGQSYPAVYFIGDYNGVAGIYRSIDNCATWATLSIYPNNYIGFFSDITGDPDEFGKVYLATGHNGGLVGNYNYAMSLS